MAHFATMVDLAKSPEEIAEDMPIVAKAVNAGKVSAPVYPYGCCISLDEDVLEKVGLDGELPQVGEMIHLCAMAKVTSVSESEREDGNGGKSRCCRVELQITHLATESEDDEAEMAVQASAARRKRFYDNPAPENDGD